MDRKEIYVHLSVHRVKNSARENDDRKTEIQVEEIPTKGHIRTVMLPEEIIDYMREFYISDGFVLSGQPDVPVDARTLSNRMNRILELHEIKEINFQRLRKTYVNGKADEQILTHIFHGMKRMTPYARSLDVRWLTEEMITDLASLRLLIGLSVEEMSNIFGISKTVYKDMEAGRRSISWNQYLALLFVFYYNNRTRNVVNILGLYPDSLKEKMSLSGV